MTGTTTGIRRCSSTCCGRKCWRPEVCTQQRRRRTGTTPTCWRHPLNPTTPTSSAHSLGMSNGVSHTSSFACDLQLQLKTYQNLTYMVHFYIYFIDIVNIKLLLETVINKYNNYVAMTAHN